MIFLRRLLVVVACAAACVAGCGNPLSAHDSCDQNSAPQCGAGATGWSCPSDATPGSNGSDYICTSEGTAPTGEFTYCCASAVFPAGTCEESTLITNCPSAQTGFACTGSNTPDQTDPALSCAAGLPDPSTGTTLFCCCLSSSC